MNTPPDNHELDKRLAVMEERMKTINAQNESAIDRMNAIIADLKTENATRDKEAEKRDKEAARREAANTRWIMASILAGAGLIVILLH